MGDAETVVIDRAIIDTSEMNSDKPMLNADETKRNDLSLDAKKITSFKPNLDTVTDSGIIDTVDKVEIDTGLQCAPLNCEFTAAVSAEAVLPKNNHGAILFAGYSAADGEASLRTHHAMFPKRNSTERRDALRLQVFIISFYSGALLQACILLLN